MTKQTHAFQAEVAQLLHLVTHSLYSNPDIFVRELVSNASDACDKLRFEALHAPELFEDAAELDIRVSFDKEAKTITIADNGIGLSEAEAIDNLGTIAKSGTKDFVSKLSGDQKKDSQLIGQFGVGFYSGYIVAHTITVESRRAGAPKDQGVRWVSGGTGEWEAVNSASALWTRAKKDISDQQYQDFYKNISHDHDNPLAWSHNRVEGSTEYTQLLYVPAKARQDLWSRDTKAGIKLYVKRVFITDDADTLMPTYLRFVQGVVDSADLPLNVSRELLQESRDMKAIREGNTRRVLSMLEDLAKKSAAPTDQASDVTDVTAKEDGDAAQPSADTYNAFYAEFGAVLKEGLGEDFANRDKIAKLLRFASSQTDTVTLSLADYKARMKEGQEAIYYITADSQAAAKNSPQLEVFKKKGIEVLLMTDRVDEWALSFLPEFDGTPLQSVAKGAVDLGKLQDEGEKKAAETAAESFKPMLDKLKAALEGKAKDVRVTTRLVDSPACLVVDDGEYSTQLARMLKQAGQQAPDIKPVLEVNAEHPLVKKLEGSASFDDLAHILFDQALLAEGGLPEDPASYVRRVNTLLV